MKQKPKSTSGERVRAHVLIVEARFYDDLLNELGAGARDALSAVGVTHETVTVPGSLEVPGAIALAEATGRFDGYVALGVVIRGETSHYELVSGESARGLMALTLDGIAVGNGILTVETLDQAWVRARRAEMNKGAKAAEAALALIRLRRCFAGS